MKKHFFVAALFAQVAMGVLFSGCDHDVNPPIDDPDTTNTKADYAATWLAGNCRYGDLEADRLMWDVPTIYTAVTKISNAKLREGGDKIVAVRAYLADDAKEINIFIGRDYRQPAVQKLQTYAKGGWQYVMPDSAIAIGDADFFVGYTTTSRVAYVEESRKILAGELIKTDGDYISVYDTYGKYAFKIQAVMTGNASTDITADVAVDNIHATQYAVVGDAINPQIEIRNAGNATVKNPEVTASLAGRHRSAAKRRQ